MYETMWGGHVWAQPIFILAKGNVVDMIFNFSLSLLPFFLEQGWYG